jgi:hypothetical protein
MIDIVFGVVRFSILILMLLILTFLTDAAPLPPHCDR